MLDQIEGRLLLDRDRAAGTALLERAIRSADEIDPSNVDARKARSYAYSPLILDAARASQWDRVWQLLGRAAYTAASARCAVGAAVEDSLSAVVVRGGDGSSQGVFVSGRSGPSIDVPQLIPRALRESLRGCPEVEVLARPPVAALPQILPDNVAWSYRLGGDHRDTAPSPVPPRTTRLVIANAEPPASLGLARLPPWRSSELSDITLEGASATPSRALSELAEATFAEIHVHGVAGLADAAFLMLSPEPDGRFALTASAIQRQPLRGRPIVVLAACQAAKPATYRHEVWSLPAAFLTAGARAVIASSEVIVDDDAGAFFDDLRARIERRVSPAIALRDTRAAWLTTHPDAGWVHSLMVFQ